MPMRQLRRCDFCGGDAAGVYEVLPPELSPTEAEQQRLVLCSDCAGTLETVVDPLLERLGVGTGEGAPAAGGASSDPEGQVGDSVSGDSDGTSDPDSRDRPHPDDAGVDADGEPEPIEWGTSGPDGDTPGASERPPSDPLHDGTTGADRSPDVDPSAEADSSVGAGPSADADRSAEPPASEPTATGDAAGTEADDGGASATDDGSAGATDDGSADATDATAPDPEDGEGTDTAGGEEPDEFRTVMRLLGNREFPVDRGAIVELAASAYELDERHVHRVLDYAVDRGVIAEDGHTLRRN